MATSDVRDQLQTALGDAYRIERELPPGGMSRLFLATERSLDRHVVIKLLPPEYASEVSAARFQREVTLTAHLQHPHILPILSAGSRDGLLYYVLPYVEGESLRQRLNREGKLPVSAAVQILREVADALARAHEAGVVHRDIKPENILLQRDHALLADFGVARALHEATGSQRLTDTGMGLGTPGYMAPEQLAGERHVDARADVYALAVVGYEMLSGTPPFTGATPRAVAAAHFTGAPKPLTRVRPEVPQPVSDAIAKALGQEPDRRFATAAEFRDALGDALAGPRARSPALRRSVGAAATAVVLALGVVEWRRSHAGLAPAASAAGPVRLAVLPFENAGDSADAYFADGMTDAVREKLTALVGLEVLAPASSGQYRHTTKPVGEIGRELRVQYLVVGKVRWAKSPGGASRVEVRPALIEVRSAADKWEQSFDAPLTDVFQVQAAIADKVASQLRVTLTPTAEQTLAARPTRNLEAYDAYLRGRDIARGGSSPTVQRRAAAAFREAVRLDSTFAEAWAALGIARSVTYANGVPTPTLGDSARSAAARALSLAPDLPAAHGAMGAYYEFVGTDFARAHVEYAAGLAAAPNSASLLSRTAGVEQELGHWDAALGHLQQATRLDPRSTGAVRALADAQMYLRHYPAAREAADRAVALRPDNLLTVHSRVMVALAEGDLPGARSVLQTALAAADTATLVAFVANYYDLGWVLDTTEERKLLGLGPAAFDGDKASWGIVLAQQYALRGDRVRARTYADTARAAFEGHLKGVPDDSQQHVLLGLALAYLGRKADAVREGERGVALHPVSKDAVKGAYYQHQLARIYLLVGVPERALDELEPLLKIPYYLSPAWLRIDPTFAPLRRNPRFERLIAQAH